MKHTPPLFILTLILIISCHGKEGTNNSASSRNTTAIGENVPLPEKFVSPDHRLLDFKISLVNTIGDLNSRDSIRYNEIFSKHLIATTDTIRYLNKKIYVSCIQPAGGCAEYKGDLLFRNDTIILLLKNVSETACAEMEEWRTIYEIENNDNKKYVVQKRF